MLISSNELRKYHNFSTPTFFPVINNDCGNGNQVRPISVRSDLGSSACARTGSWVSRQRGGNRKLSERIICRIPNLKLNFFNFEKLAGRRGRLRSHPGINYYPAQSFIRSSFLKPNAASSLPPPPLITPFNDARINSLLSPHPLSPATGVGVPSDQQKTPLKGLFSIRFNRRPLPVGIILSGIYPPHGGLSQ